MSDPVYHVSTNYLIQAYEAEKAKYRDRCRERTIDFIVDRAKKHYGCEDMPEVYEQQTRAYLTGFSDEELMEATYGFLEGDVC